MKHRIILADRNIVKEVSRTRSRYNQLLSYERRRNRMLLTTIDCLSEELASAYRLLETTDKSLMAANDKLAETQDKLIAANKRIKELMAVNDK